MNSEQMDSLFSQYKLGGKATGIKPYKPNIEKPLLTGEQVKRNLHKTGGSLRNFAAAHGYSYETVSAVVRGRIKCTYGKSHEIAVKLGMVAADPHSQVAA